MDTFLTVTRKDYKWPASKPIVLRPTQPEITTKPKKYYMYRDLEAFCHCSYHSYEPKVLYYRKLKEAEAKLFEKLDLLNQKMTETSNLLLEHPCDTDDDKLKSLYQIDYQMYGCEIPEYRKLIADIDANAPNPIKLAKTEFLEGYRDPMSFRYSAIRRPLIDSGPPVSFKTTPRNLRAYCDTGIGRTEYEDTYDKYARSTVNNMQQYKEPYPSSRRRFADPTL